MSEFWYRMDGTRYASPVDEFDNPVGRGRCGVHICKFEVISKTPKGIWLDTFLGKRFVLCSARKMYANPTESEAIASFIARKRRQVKILKAQLETAQELISLAGAYKPEAQRLAGVR